MPSVRLSPGRLTALWIVLRSLHRLGDSAVIEDLRRTASRTSLRSGGLPVGDGLKLALEGQFLTQQDDRLVISPLGREALDLSNEEEPTDDVRLLFVSSLLLRDPPAWVSFWQGDAASLSLALPASERLLLEQCGLYPEGSVADLASWAWWDALKEVPLPEETGQYRKMIGDAGEQLSLTYEQARLQAEGFSELSRRVRWVARESAAYGFDILSYSGKTDNEPSRPLAIEVKSVAKPVVDVFPLYLTEHEWRTSKTLEPYYIFHLWDGVDPGPPVRSRRPGPLLVQSNRFDGHLPSRPQCDDPCRWVTAQVLLSMR